MHQFLLTYPFLTPLLAGILCECAKILIETVRTGVWHESLFRAGGFPSSHSATVMSLLIVVGHGLGVDSIEFAMAMVLACIVWYDAAGSRAAIGNQARILNRLQHFEHLTERLGHSLKEVIGGMVFGAMVSWAVLLTA